MLVIVPGQATYILNLYAISTAKLTTGSTQGSRISYASPDMCLEHRALSLRVSAISYIQNLI